MGPKKKIEAKQENLPLLYPQSPTHAAWHQRKIFPTFHFEITSLPAYFSIGSRKHKLYCFADGYSILHRTIGFVLIQWSLVHM